MKNNRQIVTFSLLFSLFFATILASPLLVYYNYMSALYETKIEYELAEQAKKIVAQMDSFDSRNDKYFYFPRYTSYQAGLFKADGSEIFSTIKHQLPEKTQGIHYVNDKCYLVYKLIPKYYFGADFLIVSAPYNTNEILSRVLLVATGILLLIFVSSLFLIKEFERPYRRANAMMDEFIVNTMHELNTPLSIVMVNTEMLEEKHGSSRHTDRIKAAVKTLSTIYDDMDYMVKNERLEYSNEELNFSDFLESRALYFDDIAKTKNLKIERDIKSGVSCFFNHVRLQRVVDNTISNAIKYSKDDSEKIVLRLYLDSGSAVFECSDFGIGIERPEEIFDRYYREDNSKGGFGIGLNIVKAICAEESVGVSVESVFGVGSTFRYRFRV